MATLPFFPSLIPSSSSSSSSSSNNLHLLHHSSTAHFHLHASSSSSVSATTNHNTKTTRTRRRSRRLKTDAEICNDIREFLASVGLPHHHVPSTKELLRHGRNDLANIVRRRGHKQIEELLTSSFNANLDSETSFDERPDSADDCRGLLTDECTSTPVGSSANPMMDNGISELTDHIEVVDPVEEGYFYHTEVAVADNDFSSSREGLSANFSNQSSIMPLEISGEQPFGSEYSENSESEQSLVGKTVGDTNLPSPVLSMENHYSSSFNDSETVDAEEYTCELEALDDSNNNTAEDVRSFFEVSTMENLSVENQGDSAHSAGSNSINVDSLANLSLEEKVANFIQNGDLDPVEDGYDSQENKVNIGAEAAVDMPLGILPPEDNNSMAHNGSSLTSQHVVPSGTSNQLFGDEQMQHVDLTTNSDEDLDAEVSNVPNQSEINYLKFMLYQKELELFRLKEQIVKEKLALSVLQTKAEAEIDKAKKVISEKDAELHDAEESLTGLKEVQLEFCCDAEVVEVAGSFNGWHHRIKLDPDLLASASDYGGSRKIRFWSTTLWLYPGVYEIKFVVDGHWRLDPQRESVSRGHICNNILRVDI
ncbi:protein PTST homolog 3, chloroplastic isoform X2 [Arachis stenosperma]|uniref:protein PTST homolog 3, chloroplastic isoform X2 n=1 Tax=Arachis stenosperma TaxID=217475 RepID=UPI0025ABFA5F|nr:protein PTST homolog 3, chloroplastic isoform X2 [Arachis stenosperma]